MNNQEKDPVRVVAVSGQRGAGKDECGKILVEEGFCRLSFADALYREAAEHYGVPEFLLRFRPWKDRAPVAWEGRIVLDGRSPREVLIDWGQMRREEDPEYWIRRVEETILEAAENGTSCAGFVITDLRFENELDALDHLHQQGVAELSVFRVYASGDPEKRPPQKVDVSNDPSETGLDHIDLPSIPNVFGAEDWREQLRVQVHLAMEYPWENVLRGPVVIDPPKCEGCGQCHGTPGKLVGW